MFVLAYLFKLSESPPNLCIKACYNNNYFNTCNNNNECDDDENKKTFN